MFLGTFKCDWQEINLLYVICGELCSKTRVRTRAFLAKHLETNVSVFVFLKKCSVMVLVVNVKMMISSDFKI